ncbi:hypothetical protein BJY01DRAFT_40127 [Aspergillus pseudoustus]|uniref:Uncharacterized protein n=1 Tax=Aspergillus pseudoustus TaxID=1810923 RepID=A0ABR4JDV3_9EURO
MAGNDGRREDAKKGGCFFRHTNNNGLQFFSSASSGKSKASPSLNLLPIYRLHCPFHTEFHLRKSHPPRCSCQSPSSSPDFLSPPPRSLADRSVHSGFEALAPSNTPSLKVDSDRPTISLEYLTHLHCLVSLASSHACSTPDPRIIGKSRRPPSPPWPPKCISFLRRIGERV